MKTIKVHMKLLTYMVAVIIQMKQFWYINYMEKIINPEFYKTTLYLEIY